jgi:hypothetical protein
MKKEEKRVISLIKVEKKEKENPTLFTVIDLSNNFKITYGRRIFYYR